MAIDKSQAMLLKRLVQDDGWDILTGVVLKSFIDDLKKDEITGAAGAALTIAADSSCTASSKPRTA